MDRVLVSKNRVFGFFVSINVSVFVLKNQVLTYVFKFMQNMPQTPMVQRTKKHGLFLPETTSSCSQDGLHIGTERRLGSRGQQNFVFH